MCDLQGCGPQNQLPPIPLSSQQRRLFLQGLACLPLATVLSYPELAKAAAATTQEASFKLEMGDEVKASVALPASPEKAPAVLLIHEWWGLNDQIKAVAAELANMGYLAIAVDLYAGKVAANADEAKELMGKIDPEMATETMKGWVEWARKHERSSGKVATLGWCFGGGWSLNTSVATPVDATVIYYGRVEKPVDELKQLAGPVMGHFGKLDKSINEEMVKGFEKNMEAAGKTEALTVYWYDADHAFANPSGARYDEANAKLAWERTSDFLKMNLQSA
ncbi:dienelactone hydrolase family protein [Thiolinea disciformis]|uniref:dienelactone hydrolase family protein n=1 Tax=Thiolinea disciformis TaxID=125614 RepID=UPI0003676720|nr:dienelactone hydrolase family protein [Thiolinea disciformis]